MKVDVVAITSTDEEVIKTTSKENLELTGGHSANICYTQKDWKEIVHEDYNKTKIRIEGNKVNNHHSVFGHGHISLYISGVPKLLAMLLNNEHEYNTSEKSARYTKMMPTKEELMIYEKWISILEQEIKRIYPNEKYLDDKRIHKLAMENARYFISVLTPTKFEYTTSFRQLNYIYDFCLKLLEDKSNNKLIEAIKPSVEDFATELEKTGFITKDIKDYRHRKFSLIVENNDYPEQFGRTYSTNYQASFAEVAQQQRHRTLYYTISYSEVENFYIPPIISENENLKKIWLNDMYYLHDLLKIIPQGTLVNVNETGTYENFILKLQERLCTAAQLETSMQCKKTLEKYIEALKAEKDSRIQPILTELEKMNVGARCLSGYNCTNPCGFKEGIKLTRKI